MADTLGKYNPLRLFRRSKESTIGPAKDWNLWKSIISAWGGDSKQQVDAKTRLSIPAYTRALTVLSEQIASLPFSVYRIGSDGSITEATSHPLYRLLNFRPSAKYDSFIFRESIVRQMINGAIMQRSGNCLIIPHTDARGAVAELELVTEEWEMFKLDGEYFYKVKGKDKIFLPKEVIHLRAWSEDGIFGGDPVGDSTDTLGRAISEIKFGAKFYGNGAQISGVLQSDLQLNEEQINIVRNSWESKYSGPDKFGKTAVLSAGFKYQPIGSRLDVSDIEARRLTVEDISNITGVPAFLLSNLERATFANIELLNKVFVQYTIRAWCRRIESEFNTKLFPASEWGRTYVRFNLDGLLRGDSASRSAYYRELYNIRALSPNEIRQMENMNPYPGGDAFGLPLASNSQTQQDATGETNL